MPKLANFAPPSFAAPSTCPFTYGRSTLGLKDGEDDPEKIKQAYKKSAMKWHPDRVKEPQKKEAEAKYVPLPHLLHLHLHLHLHLLASFSPLPFFHLFLSPCVPRPPLHTRTQATSRASSRTFLISARPLLSPPLFLQPRHTAGSNRFQRPTRP
jgi:hypothetical protein